MEGSQKGAAVNSGSKATSASLDEDFGKDFLTSWNSTKFGNDAMDFDMETSEGKGKGKKFNFGKLDDFDLDADFDKLPSFKMDMSDLDFSSPVKKNSKPSTEKSHKDSSHGKDKEKESFSFSFNFDDLGKFDLDSHLTIKKKEKPQLEPSTSVEHGLSETQKDDLPTEIMDIPKIDSSKAPSKPEASSSTSGPPSTEKQPSKVPSCDLSSGSDQLARRRFSVPSISGHSNYREAHVSQSHSVKENSDNKTDNGAQSSESHPQLMRNASPVTSSNNQDCLSGACSSYCGLSKNEDSTNLSAQNEPNSNLVGVKEVRGEKGINSTDTISATQRLTSKTTTAIASATHRHLELNARQEKATSFIYKPQPKSALSSEQSGDRSMIKKLPNSNSQDMERQSDIGNAHAKNSLITAMENTSKLTASVGNGKPEIENNALSTLKNTNGFLPTDNASLKTEKQKIMTHLLTSSTLKNTNGFLPTDNASLKTEKQKIMTHLLTSRLTKMKQIRPSETPESDLQLAKLREINKVPLQLPALNSASKRKPALLSPPLKRKVIEDFVPDPFTPLKRISSSPAEARNSPKIALKAIYNSPLESRKSPEIAFRPESQMVTRSEAAEVFKDNSKSLDYTTETVVGIADFEIPVPVLENNGNVEKAETISKELGDINSMLKKKQEEAKELLVRAMVSNNKLLMLNHPMYAEKLSSLERFASTLRAKHF